MQLITIKNGENIDLSAYVLKIEWSGDIKQAARTLSFALVYRENDKNMPRAEVAALDCGNVVELRSDDGVRLFYGFIFRVDKELGASKREFWAYDGLIYVSKSNISVNFKAQTARQITKTVCARFGITAGDMASDAGVKMTFAHIGKPAYEAIMGAWQKVSAGTRCSYMAIMDGTTLRICKVGEKLAQKTLSTDTDILDSKFSCALEDMVNYADIVSDTGKILATAKNDEERGRYGTIYGSNEKKDDAGTAQSQARDMLKSPERTATISDMIGGKDKLDIITGVRVAVKEPISELCGVFYVVNDTHTFANGRHKISLGLEWRATMYESDLKFDKVSGGSGADWTGWEK